MALFSQANRCGQSLELQSACHGSRQWIEFTPIPAPTINTFKPLLPRSPSTPPEMPLVPASCGLILISVTRPESNPGKSERCTRPQSKNNTLARGMASFQIDYLKELIRFYRIPPGSIWAFRIDVVHTSSGPTVHHCGVAGPKHAQKYECR